MSISYLISDIEIAVLLHLCGAKEWRGIPALSAIGQDESKGALVQLEQRGIVQLSSSHVKIDPAFHFVLQTIIQAQSIIVIPTLSLAVYMTDQLGILQAADRHSSENRYRMIPCKDAQALIQRVKEYIPHNGRIEQAFLWSGGAAKASAAAVTLTEIQKIITSTYTYKEKH